MRILLFCLPVLFIIACGPPAEEQGDGDGGSNPQADAGTNTADAGNDEGDGGNAPADSGGTPVDAGGSPMDAGGGPMDAGSNPVDAGTTYPDAGPIEGEPEGLVGVTQAHNDARAEKGVGPMVWDPELAVVAQTWADACVDETAPAGLVDHNSGRSDNYPGYVGENIYGSSGSASGINAVASWVSEEAYYDYDANSCSGVCGHYTQVVWAASTKLGCGISNCSGLTYSGTIVCNYSPGGNSGGRPY